MACERLSHKTEDQSVGGTTCVKYRELTYTCIAGNRYIRFLKGEGGKGEGEREYLTDLHTSRHQMRRGDESISRICTQQHL